MPDLKPANVVRIRNSQKRKIKFNRQFSSKSQTKARGLKGQVRRRKRRRRRMSRRRRRRRGGRRKRRRRRPM